MRRNAAKANCSHHSLFGVLFRHFPTTAATLERPPSKIIITIWPSSDGFELETS